MPILDNPTAADYGDTGLFVAEVRNASGMKFNLTHSVLESPVLHAISRYLAEVAEREVNLFVSYSKPTRTWRLDRRIPGVSHELIGYVSISARSRL